MRFPRCLWVPIAAAILAGAAPAQAQTGSIVGIVTDTLNRRRLAGAFIEVAGLERHVTSDAGGRFTIDSVPPGTYQLSFRHPVLDTLGFQSAAFTVTVAAGTEVRVAPGIPSGRSFMRLCPLPDGAESRSAVFGVLRNAASDEPIAAAPIRVSWATFLPDMTLGVRRLVETRADTTDALGRYLACDLPPAANVTVTALPPGFDPVMSDVQLRSEEAVPLPLHAAPTGLVANAMLTGQVLDGDRRPLAGADVWVVMGNGRESAVARTDSGGRFSLGGLTPGTGTVAARRIGSAPSTRTLALVAGGSTAVQLTLAQQTLTLPELTVEAKATGRAAQFGFPERAQRGFGKFFDAEALDRLAALDAGSVLRQLPFIRVLEGQPGGTVLSNSGLRGSVSGGPCALALLVDGMITPPEVIMSLPKNYIEAVEVYNTAEEVPLEFRGSGTSCGAVLVWTRR